MLWTADGALPNGVPLVDEAPWEAIERLVDGVELVDLAAVYVDETRPRMHLIWLGHLNGAVDRYVWRDTPTDCEPVWRERWTAVTDPMRVATQFVRASF